MLPQPIIKPRPDLIHDDGPRYELVENYFIPGYECGVPKGFIFDGASIPAIAWHITYTPFHPLVIAPALYHDWPYVAHNISRDKADSIFLELLLENGVPKLTAKKMHFAVEKFGGMFWGNSEKQDKDVIRLFAMHAFDEDIDRFGFPALA